MHVVLHPIPTRADGLTYAPCVLTFAPCTCGVFLLSNSATIPVSQVVHSLQLSAFFIQPLAQMLHLSSGNLHCAVVVCDCIIYVYIIICGYKYEAIQKPKSGAAKMKFNILSTAKYLRRY